ncbi:MAG: hypothetical protein DRN90_01060, partial [Thermoproteota archaeon]
MTGYFRQSRWQRKGELIEPTIFELSQGRKDGYYRFSIEKEVLEEIGNTKELIPEKLMREKLNLPN